VVCLWLKALFQRKDAKMKFKVQRNLKASVFLCVFLLRFILSAFALDAFYGFLKKKGRRLWRLPRGIFFFRAIISFWPKPFWKL
jgi:hypothetical protein